MKEGAEKTRKADKMKEDVKITHTKKWLPISSLLYLTSYCSHLHSP
jgi:hypothetical protein